jgi:hypothetical protein
VIRESATGYEYGDIPAFPANCKPASSIGEFRAGLRIAKAERFAKAYVYGNVKID